jgi:hypothetical protein
MWRYFRIRRPAQDAEAREFRQTLIQNFRAQAIDGALDCSGATHAAFHQCEHLQRPLAADDVLDHTRDGRNIARRTFLSGRQQDAPESK